MSGDMVERVARALAPVAWAALGTGDTLANQSRRTASLRHARAAIAAMREPTQQMQDSGRDANDRYATEAAPCSAMRAHDAWTAMIDCALAQPE